MLLGSAKKKNSRKNFELCCIFSDHDSEDNLFKSARNTKSMKYSKKIFFFYIATFMLFSSDQQHSFSGLLHTGTYSRAVLREEVEEIFWR